MTMMLSYKYRAYPKGEVEAKAITSIDAARYVYNHFLEQKNLAWKNHATCTTFDLINELPALKKENPFLKEPYSHMLQTTVKRIFDGITSLHGAKAAGRRVGKLRFKDKRRFKSIRYNSQGYRVDGNVVTLSKIGSILFEMHRPLPDKIDGVILKHVEDEWYVIFQVEVTDVDPTPLSDNNAVGLDVGVNKFVVDSDGHEVENPKFLAQKLDRIKFLQRSLSRKEKGSNNRNKARRLLAQVFDKASNIRANRNHQISRRYVNSYDTIVVEDLNIPDMVNKQHNIKKMSPSARRTLRRNIHDAAWGDFTRKLEYKAEGAGKRVIRVNAKNTTQRCSRCGELVLKDITVRTHTCPYCGFEMDRDQNASRNILNEGLKIIRAGNLPQPAEENASATRKSRKRLTMKQEATALEAW